jgi:hypothetical protein
MPQVPPHQFPPRQASDQCSTAQSEARLYVPEHDGWTAVIKHDWNKEYCFSQNPGDDHYHLMLSGEIYLQRGTEKYCLNCALRHGFVTRDRTFWQKGPSSVTETPIVAISDEGEQAQHQL